MPRGRRARIAAGSAPREQGIGMVELATWLASLPFSRALRQLNWLVPWLQIIHILANGIILSAVVMIDLRVWGISRSQSSVAMARRFQLWIWAGLAVLTVSGILLILYRRGACWSTSPSR